MKKTTNYFLAAFSGLGSVLSIAQLIRWALSDRGVMHIAGSEFDSRLLVDIYSWTAFLLLLPVLYLTFPLLLQSLRSKSYRLYDLREEISRGSSLVSPALVALQSESDAAEMFQRLEILHGKLLKLGVVIPPVEDIRLEFMEKYLKRLKVLAEHRKYGVAKDLWEDM